MHVDSPPKKFLGADLTDEEFDALLAAYLISGYGALCTLALSWSNPRGWTVDQFSHIVGRVMVRAKLDTEHNRAP